MNNEKLILRALANIQHNQLQSGTFKEFRNNITAIEEALNPKEDAPYEKSIQEGCGCKHCRETGCIAKNCYMCEKFVKSSKGEENDRDN